MDLSTEWQQIMAQRSSCQACSLSEDLHLTEVISLCTKFDIDLNHHVVIYSLRGQKKKKKKKNQC